MCTAATYRTKAFYFGRTLDYELSYVVTPKNFPFSLRRMGNLESHHAMIGMAHVISGCPLFYDAINEKGLAMAGLNFVGNAVYRKDEPGKDNVATFEFIPWILGQAATVSEAKKLCPRLSSTGSLRTGRKQSPWNLCPTDSGSMTILSASSQTILPLTGS